MEEWKKSFKDHRLSFPLYNVCTISPFIISSRKTQPLADISATLFGYELTDKYCIQMPVSFSVNVFISSSLWVPQQSFYLFCNSGDFADFCCFIGSTSCGSVVLIIQLNLPIIWWFGISVTFFDNFLLVVLLPRAIFGFCLGVSPRHYFHHGMSVFSFLVSKVCLHCHSGGGCYDWPHQFCQDFLFNFDFHFGAYNYALENLKIVLGLVLLCIMTLNIQKKKILKTRTKMFYLYILLMLKPCRQQPVISHFTI